MLFHASSSSYANNWYSWLFFSVMNQATSFHWNCFIFIYTVNFSFWVFIEILFAYSCWVELKIIKICTFKVVLVVVDSTKVLHFIFLHKNDYHSKGRCIQKKIPKRHKVGIITWATFPQFCKWSCKQVIRTPKIVCKDL